MSRIDDKAKVTGTTAAAPTYSSRQQSEAAEQVAHATRNGRLSAKEKTLFTNGRSQDIVDKQRASLEDAVRDSKGAKSVASGDGFADAGNKTQFYDGTKTDHEKRVERLGNGLTLESLRADAKDAKGTIGEEAAIVAYETRRDEESAVASVINDKVALRGVLEAELASVETSADLNAANDYAALKELALAEGGPLDTFNKYGGQIREGNDAFGDDWDTTNDLTWDKMVAAFDHGDEGYIDSWASHQGSGNDDRGRSEQEMKDYIDGIDPDKTYTLADGSVVSEVKVMTERYEATKQLAAIMKDYVAARDSSSDIEESTDLYTEQIEALNASIDADMAVLSPETRAALEDYQGEDIDADITVTPAETDKPAETETETETETEIDTDPADSDEDAPTPTLANPSTLEVTDPVAKRLDGEAWTELKINGQKTGVPNSAWEGSASAGGAYATTTVKDAKLGEYEATIKKVISDGKTEYSVVLADQIEKPEETKPVEEETKPEPNLKSPSTLEVKDAKDQRIDGGNFTTMTINGEKTSIDASQWEGNPADGGAFATTTVTDPKLGTYEATVRKVRDQDGLQYSVVLAQPIEKPKDPATTTTTDGSDGTSSTTETPATTDTTTTTDSTTTAPKTRTIDYTTPENRAKVQWEATAAGYLPEGASFNEAGEAVYTVQPGDSYWRITDNASPQAFDPVLFQQTIDTNSARLGRTQHPTLIHPDETIILPNRSVSDLVTLLALPTNEEYQEASGGGAGGAKAA